MKINEMPLKLARVYTKALNLIDSNVTGFQVEKYTGVDHTLVYRLRDHQRKISALTLRTALLFANYPNKGLPRKFGHRVTKIENEYYISTAAVRYDIDENDIRSKIADVMTASSNLSALSRKLHISRSRLSHFRYGRYNVYSQHVNTLAVLLNEWALLKQRGLIKTSSANISAVDTTNN